MTREVPGEPRVVNAKAPADDGGSIRGRFGGGRRQIRGRERRGRRLPLAQTKRKTNLYDQKDRPAEEQGGQENGPEAEVQRSALTTAWSKKRWRSSFSTNSAFFSTNSFGVPTGRMNTGLA